MDLSIYNIIQRPRVTSKAYMLNQKHKQLVLEVHPEANKPLIKEALKKLFNVEAEKIRVVVSKGKYRRAGRHAFQDKKRKKAIITLKDGYAVDLAGFNNVAESQPAPSESSQA